MSVLDCYYSSTSSTLTCPVISVSEIVDEAIRIQLPEDQEDLAIFDERAREPEISYEALLNDLKKHGKI